MRTEVFCRALKYCVVHGLFLFLCRNGFAQGHADNARPSDLSKSTEYAPAYPAATETPLKSPKLTDSLFMQAKSFAQRGKLAEADEAARGYLKVHPASADGHYLLGYILFRRANARESLAEYTEGAKYRTPTAFDLEVVACDYVLLNDYVDADKWFTKAVEWNPKDALVWYYLGRTKYNENRFDEAIKAFLQCLKLDPKNVKAADNLGLSYAGAGRVDEATQAYKNAIAWQANELTKNSGPFLDFGILLVDNGRPQDALQYLRQAVQVSPQDAQTHAQLGKAYLHLNQLEESQAAFEKAVELNPQDAPLRFMLAQVYRREGLKDKAKRELDRYAVLNAAHSSPQALK
jgi:tetratricopeptide (TPR) repeat protein